MVAGTAAEIERRVADAVDRASVTGPGNEVISSARAVHLCRVSRPAVVLGSSQPSGTADRARLAAEGVDLARRRTGGGAVLVAPGELVWLELTIGRSDQLWQDDVGRSMAWVGRCWADALSELGVAGAAVHGGPPEQSKLSRLVCFGGMGAGEVSLGGRKVVGVAQRRGPWGARFQCAALLRWDPARLIGLLALTQAERREMAVALAGRAAALPGVGRGELEDCVLAHLP